MMSGCSAVLLAAGSSRRLGFDKMLTPLAGRPGFLYAFEVLTRISEINEILVVTRNESREAMQPHLEETGSGIPWRFVEGGNERQESVSNGIRQADPANGFILIHDAARPLICETLVRAVLEAAEQTVVVASTGTYVADRSLVRSSRMTSITWTGGATELDEGEVLVGTISLNTDFPKADTEISLAAILGDAGRFELRDAVGDPLVGDLVIPAGDTSVDFQVYAVPNAVIEGPETLTLRATCDQIPESAVDSSDQTLDAPSLTLNEAGRVVRLRYDGEAGALNRYTDLDSAIAGDPPDDTDVTDGSGWAGFWSSDTAEAAGYHFVPTVVKPTSN